MAKPKNLPGFVALRLPQELDDKVRAAAQVTGASISDLIRSALCAAWGIKQNPQEQAGAGR